MTWRAWSPQPQRDAPVRFVFTPPPSQPLIMQGNDRDVAIAPDGSFIVYRSGTASADAAIALGARRERARASPPGGNDQRPVSLHLPRWALGGVPGRPRDSEGSGCAEARRRSSPAFPALPRGASWGEDDYIVFGTPNGLQRVPADGGEPTALTTTDPNKPEQHVLPHLLPGGKWLVVHVLRRQQLPGRAARGPRSRDRARKTGIAGGHDARIDSGYLVYGLTNPSG